MSVVGVATRPVCFVSTISRALERRLSGLFGGLGYDVLTRHDGEETLAGACRVVCAEVTGPASRGFQLLESAAAEVPGSWRVAVADGRGAAWLARAAEEGVVQLVLDGRRADRELARFLRDTVVGIG